MRPKHYIKNLLIFLPLVFSGLLLNMQNLKITFLGYLIFCFVASTIYIINDIKDKEKDSKHNMKKKRPIASGKVSVRAAIMEAILLLIISFFIIVATKISKTALLFLFVYFVLNIGYSLGLKNVPLIDILILVSGFVIRVLFGASLLGIQVSNWLYLTILSVSFYMGLGKRRNEIDRSGIETRAVLKFYTKDFLDKNMYMFLCMAIIFYSLWTTDSAIVTISNNFLIYTIPLVIVICMKYSLDIEANSDGDPIEVIFKDKLLLVLGFILVVVMFLILYVF